MDIATFKSVAEIGISGTIAVIFLRQQQKLFGQQEQVIQVLAKLEQNLNSDILKGQALEQCLLLKVQEITEDVFKLVRDKFHLKALIEDIALEGKAETGKM